MNALLLQKEFLENLENKNLGICNIPIGYQLKCKTTNNREFDILDEQINFILPKETGGTTFINNSSDSINILDYEDFIQNLINKKSKIKSCDFIVYSTKPNFFICNELSVGCSSDKWPKARYQFTDTIKYLYKSSNIKNFVNGFNNKICLLSLRESTSSAPLDEMIAGFNIPYTLQKEPEKLNWKPIEDNFGFEIWEADLFQYNTDESYTILKTRLSRE